MFLNLRSDLYQESLYEWQPQEAGTKAVGADIYGRAGGGFLRPDLYAHVCVVMLVIG